ncbi:unnamed protein product [Parascedosporium putredinis]|uniref:EF-hand domain-containing protein n=1 Tax=Parascedosporium putredinis TaxID=1442378 RepID=A0A9P1HCX2_9PEZI|nr:unnamed protein product [Parascedosporium putredinis]CAI8004871.1 unnamed protein product [Parascedosporium putredinis]
MPKPKSQKVAAKRTQVPPIATRLERTGPGGNSITLTTSNLTNGDTDSEKTQEQDNYTVLEQHIRYWDPKGDGKITPLNTYNGFRGLGFNILFSFLAMAIIHFAFSYPTRLAYSYIPDPFFRIYVHGIYKAKHGSSTGVYDSEGRFVGQVFNNMFSKWDNDKDGALGLKDLFEMMHANRDVMDPFGWCAAFLELGTTWLLIQKDGKVYKEDLRRVYDGSIFYKIRDDIDSGKGWEQGFGPRDLGKLFLKKIAVSL